MSELEYGFMRVIVLGIVITIGAGVLGYIWYRIGERRRPHDGEG